MKQFKDYFKIYSILNEMNQAHVQYVLDNLGRDKPFENVFEGKDRILIPIKGAETYNEILDALSSIKHFNSFDPDSGMVIKKIPKPEKYGGGFKTQKVKLGKAIEQLKIPEDKKKKFLNWYAKYKSNIKELEENSKYSIILSRHPVDVLRMADFNATESCHSQEGGYFSCAIEEAINGGGVAYVVPSTELLDFTDDDLQEDEIFIDRERYLQSRTPRMLDPLSRLRLRRYVQKDNNYELAIPETSTYGRDIAGFYETVRNFLFEKQNNITLHQIRKDFNGGNLIRTGGSYSDSSDSDLFNVYFNANYFYGSTQHQSPEHEDYSSSVQIENELERIKERYESSLNHIDLDYYVFEDEYGGMYEGSASMIIKLPEGVELSDDYPLDEENRNDDGYFVTELKKDIVPNYIKTSLEVDDDTFERLHELCEDIWDDSEYEFTEHLTTITSTRESYSEILISFRPNGSTDFSNDPDDFDSFANDMESLDEKYNQIRAMIIHLFSSHGFLEGDVQNYKRMDEDEIEKFTKSLKHFSLEETTITLNGVCNIRMGENVSPQEFRENVRDDRIGFTEEFINMFEKYISLYYKPPVEMEDTPYFPTFREAFIGPTGPELEKFGITNISTEPIYDDYGYDASRVDVAFYFDMLSEDKKPLIKFIDDSYKNITYMLNYLVMKRIDIESPEFKRFEKIFGSILN